MTIDENNFSMTKTCIGNMGNLIEQTIVMSS